MPGKSTISVNMAVTAWKDSADTVLMLFSWRATEAGSIWQSRRSARRRSRRTSAVLADTASVNDCSGGRRGGGGIVGDVN